MPARRRYSYMKRNAPANRPQKPAALTVAPPEPQILGPWVRLNMAEPVTGQRVVASYVGSDAKRRYYLSWWAVTRFEPGTDKWMSIPFQPDKWVNLHVKEPNVGERVVVSYMEGAGQQRTRSYKLGKWGVAPFPPGIDFWLTIPDA